jgi:hypothetical protein
MQTDLHFYENEARPFTDLVDIIVVFQQYDATQHDFFLNIAKEVLIRVLGETAFVEEMDAFNVSGLDKGPKNLKPLSQLPAFIEQKHLEPVNYDVNASYENMDEKPPVAIRLNSQKSEDEHTALVALERLFWKHRPSHPWLFIFTIKHQLENLDADVDAAYDPITISGMLMAEERQSNTCLWLCREFVGDTLKVYLAGRDRHELIQIGNDVKAKNPTNLQVSFTVVRDKYWLRFDHIRELVGTA